MKRSPIRLVMGTFTTSLLVCLSATAIAAQVPDAPSAEIVAPAPVSDTTPLTADDAAALEPGQWLWRPDAASGGPISITVDLGQQVAYIYEGDTLIGVSTVSTGRDGHLTPVGDFTILQKQLKHRSNLYNSAPMPYMQRLTWDGVALHAGGVPGYRESHGCIHLPAAFAKILYGVTQLGASVQVIDGPQSTDGFDSETIASADMDSAGGMPVGMEH